MKKLIIIMSLVLALSAALSAHAGDCRYVDSHGTQKSWDCKTAPADADIWQQLARTPVVDLLFGLGVIALFRAVTKRIDTKADRTKDQ